MNKLFFCIVTSCLMALTSLAQAAEFTATMVHKMDDDSAMTGKATIQGQNMRIEYAMDKQTQIAIIDARARKFILLYPPMKSYVEMPWDDFQVGAALYGEPALETGAWRTVGRETLNGWECEKRIFEFKNKAEGALTAWFAVKLGAPVRIVYQGGGTSVVDYKDIVPGPASPTLFAIPAGYKKIDVPVMPEEN